MDQAIFLIAVSNLGIAMEGATSNPSYAPPKNKKLINSSGAWGLITCHWQLATASRNTDLAKIS